jgi:hypothetical protein
MVVGCMLHKLEVGEIHAGVMTAIAHVTHCAGHGAGYTNRMRAAASDSVWLLAVHLLCVCVDA